MPSKSDILKGIAKEFHRLVLTPENLQRVRAEIANYISEREQRKVAEAAEKKALQDSLLLEDAPSFAVKVVWLAMLHDARTHCTPICEQDPCEWLDNIGPRDGDLCAIKGYLSPRESSSQGERVSQKHIDWLREFLEDIRAVLAQEPAIVGKPSESLPEIPQESIVLNRLKLFFQCDGKVIQLSDRPTESIAFLEALCRAHPQPAQRKDNPKVNFDIARKYVRRAFKEAGMENRFRQIIKTVPGVGYRLNVIPKPTILA